MIDAAPDVIMTDGRYNAEDGAPTRLQCTSQFGNKLSSTASYGRIDGYLVAIVAPTNQNGCNADSSHVFLVAVMVCGGLGMGLTMPNLTISMQQAAPREHVGIALALLQSQRMVGGMLGTALTGAVVNWSYRQSIGNALAGDAASGAWRQQLANPEILLSHDMQAELLSRLAAAGRTAPFVSASLVPTRVPSAPSARAPRP